MKHLLVEKEKILHNAEIIKKTAGNKTVIAVLKANGYGLGAVKVAEILAECGITFFAVTDPEDALKLRSSGMNGDILVMRSTADEEDIRKIIQAKAIATIGSMETAVKVNAVAKELGKTVSVHLKVDTGMGRYGFLPSDTETIFSIYKDMENIRPEGIYTHFNCAFADEKRTREQYHTFLEVVEKIKAEGFEVGLLHAENSIALLRFNFSGLGAARVASAFSGRLVGAEKFGLKRVGVLCVKIHEIRWLPQNASVGYGSAFITKKPTRIAIVDAGYGEGFSTEKTHDTYRLRDCIRYCLSEIKRWVTGAKIYANVGGKNARVLGHVGLTHTVIDVTDITCDVGDEVRLSISPIMISGDVERRYV